MRKHVVVGLTAVLALIVVLSCTETDRSLDEIINPIEPALDIAQLVKRVSADGCPGVRRQGDPPQNPGGGVLVSSGECSAAAGTSCEITLDSSEEPARLFVAAELEGTVVRAFYEVDPNCAAAVSAAKGGGAALHLTIDFADSFPEDVLVLGLAYSAEDPEGRTSPVVVQFFDVRFCGDGVVDTDLGEECDDGNDNDADECTNDCTVPVVDLCGNGVVDEGEECDDGNDNDLDECRNDCTLPIVDPCGNGAADEGEECDDGNLDDGDCCSSVCTYEASGAVCDDDLFCTVEDVCDGAGVCGGSARSCDDEELCTDDSCNEESDACDNAYDESNDETCVLCGNGALDAGEDCDDGNLDDGDCCSSTCGYEMSGSVCDDDLFCTVADACDGAGACAGAARPCDDANICTDNSCNEAANVCENPYDPSNDPGCPSCAVSLVLGDIQAVDINPAAGQYAAANVSVPVALSSNSSVREVAFNLVTDPADGISRNFTVPCEALPAASGFACQFSAGSPGLGRYRMFSAIGATVGPDVAATEYFLLNFTVNRSSPSSPLVFSLMPDMVDVIDAKGQSCSLLDVRSGSVSIPDN